MRRTRLVVAACATFLCAPAAWAGAPSSWDRLTTGGQSATSQIGGARTADGALHVVWQRRSGALSYDLLHSAVSRGGAVGTRTAITSGWLGIVDAALAVDGGDLLAFFSGQRTADTNEPLFGLNLALSASSGTSWALNPASVYADDFAYARTPSVAMVGGVPFQTWYAVAEPVVHVGLDPATAAQFFPVSGEAVNQNIAVSGGSEALIAWCQGISGPKGFFAQGVGSLGQPVGAAMKMPGSSTSFEGKQYLICPPTSFRTALAARSGGGFYVAGLTGYPQRTKIRVWRVGGSVSRVVEKGSGLGDGVALAADRAGRIWVAWTKGTTVRARRSNRSATVFGEEVTLRAPRGQAAAYTLDAFAQSNRLDVLARFGTVKNKVGLFHTQTFPGLTLRASGGDRLRFRVKDAGDPVSRAKVRVGGKVLRTNADGAASTRLPPGTYRAVASKGHYVSDSARVRAR